MPVTVPTTEKALGSSYDQQRYCSAPAAKVTGVDVSWKPTAGGAMLAPLPLFEGAPDELEHPDSATSKHTIERARRRFIRVFSKVG